MLGISRLPHITGKGSVALASLVPGFAGQDPTFVGRISAQRRRWGAETRPMETGDLPNERPVDRPGADLPSACPLQSPGIIRQLLAKHRRPSAASEGPIPLGIDMQNDV